MVDIGPQNSGITAPTWHRRQHQLHPVVQCRTPATDTQQIVPLTISFYDPHYLLQSTEHERKKRPVFHSLPEPNRAWLLVVYFSR